MESFFSAENVETSCVETKLNKLAFDIKNLPLERAQRLGYLMERKAVSVKEAAEMLGVAVITIRRAIKAGRIKVFRIGIGGPFRISLDEIGNMMKGN